jgi:amidase/aspartyl-tRNA(Asn)/glutamyl-tRNA(Gln) amidotransferase subunit A
VGRAFDDCLSRLADAGILIQGCDLPMLEECGRATSEGGIIAAEAYQLHAARLSHHLQDYDPRVGPRILSGADIKAHAYVGAQKRLRELACDYHAAMTGAMAVITPTVPMLPPSLERLANDAHYTADNRRAFQFTEFANRLNLPSISLPAHTRHAEPVGLLLTGKSGQDLALLELAEQVEALLL